MLRKSLDGKEARMSNLAANINLLMSEHPYAMEEALRSAVDALDAPGRETTAYVEVASDYAVLQDVVNELLALGVDSRAIAAQIIEGFRAKDKVFWPMVGMKLDLNNQVDMAALEKMIVKYETDRIADPGTQGALESYRKIVMSLRAALINERDKLRLSNARRQIINS